MPRKQSFMKKQKFPVGLRTFKTALAIVLAMIAVDQLGATTTKLIFAMLGAMAVVQPTFRESLDSCVAQTVGVIFGALMGVVLLMLPLGPLIATWLGVILVITGYNLLRIRFSPSLPCFIVVMLCTTPDIEPISYALGRIWDTAIGLGIGMLINVLVFPYDNSRKIRGIMESLDRDVILFLEEMFDGDNILPCSDHAAKKIADVEQQMNLFASQFLLLHRRRQLRQLNLFRSCSAMAKELVAHLSVLSGMEQVGRLNVENRRRLKACGAAIKDERPLNSVMEQDVVTNYHVDKILDLRHQLLQALGGRSAEK